MDYLNYSKELNSFAYNYQSSTVSYISDDTKQRVIISKLYYSLLHYYFMLYPEIASSSAGQKHATILRIIEKDRNQEYILFRKLKKLREWADYYPLDSSPIQINIQRLLHQVNRIIN